MTMALYGPSVAPQAGRGQAGAGLHPPASIGAVVSTCASSNPNHALINPHAQVQEWKEASGRGSLERKAILGLLLLVLHHNSLSPYRPHFSVCSAPSLHYFSTGVEAVAVAVFLDILYGLTLSWLIRLVSVNRKS